MSRQKEEFKPLHGNRINMFVCGPTVYDLSHLGHARTYVAYDIIARWLRHRGYSLFYLQNITDVDDKIIARAKERGMKPLELSAEFTKEYYKDMSALGINQVSLYAKASEYIPEMIAQAQQIIDAGPGYVVEGDVYFDVSLFDDYGKLSHQHPDELKEHRIEPDPRKRNPADFSLWKSREKSEMGWDSPWGWGRPGWHLEDTAITVTHFGPTYDMHGGAIELAFPHHEAEIAQAQTATGVKPLVRYWTHTGLLTIRGEKMAKSLGNFVTIRDALKEYEPEVLRFFFANTHYRSPIDYTDSSLAEAKNGLEGLRNALHAARAAAGSEKKSKELDDAVKAARKDFEAAMDDDFNTHSALAALFALAAVVNKHLAAGKPSKPSLEGAVAAFKELGSVLGILQAEKELAGGETIAKLVQAMIEQRNAARERKDFAAADKIRADLAAAGIVLEDSPKGTSWKLK